ncbi:histidine-containing phosphotransfer protein 1-like [Asparagus officinalis]|nr:histidine-containing phosphotransfer protein 1-like [Asparagus officinalis]
MEELNQLQNKVADITLDLLREEILDEQFRQLQRLQDDGMQEFVSEMLSLYVNETEKIINEMDSDIVEGFDKVDAHAIQLKGSSVSIGAKRVANACQTILNCCKENNHAGGVEGLAILKQEYSLLKTKVEPLLSLEREIIALHRSTNAPQNR